MKVHPLNRFLICVFRPLVKIIFPYRVIGRENLPEGKPGERYMLCCNHISIVDPVYLLMGQKRPIYFMAKSELFENKFLAWLFGKVMGAFPVDRGKGDMTAVNHAFDLVNGGDWLGIFPQGTCVRSRELGNAKSGAALIACRTQATVIPVCLVTKDFHVKAFRRVTVVFGKPITPEEMQLVDEEHPKLRHASRLIMQRIDELIEEQMTNGK